MCDPACRLVGCRSERGYRERKASAPRCARLLSLSSSPSYVSLSCLASSEHTTAPCKHCTLCADLHGLTSTLQPTQAVPRWICKRWSGTALCTRWYLALTSCISYTAVLFGAGDVIAQQAIEKKGRNHDVRASLLCCRSRAHTARTPLKFMRTGRLAFYGGGS